MIRSSAKTHVTLQDQLILSQLAGFLVEDGRYEVVSFALLSWQERRILKFCS